MSTSEEVREIPPDPVDIVARLQQTVDELFLASEKLQQSPSDEAIADVYNHATEVKLAAGPILEEKFFQGSGNELLIGTGVDSIINSGNALFEKSRTIAGENRELSKFTDGLGENIVNSFITKDMSLFGTVIYKEDEEPDEEAAYEVMATAVTEQVNEHFSKIIDEYVDSIMSDSDVQAYIEQRQMEIDALVERVAVKEVKIERAKFYLGVMAAAFAGAALANRLTSKK